MLEKYKGIDLKIEIQVPAYWYKIRKKIIGKTISMEKEKLPVGIITDVLKKTGKTYCFFKVKNKKALNKIIKNDYPPTSMEVFPENIKC